MFLKISDKYSKLKTKNRKSTICLNTFKIIINCLYQIGNIYLYLVKDRFSKF